MRSPHTTTLFRTLVLLGAVAGGSSFAESTPAAAPAHPISFNRDIRPILAENCFHCHGPDSGTRKAELRLDTEAGLFENRKDDPATVIRGKPMDSELFKRIISTDAEEVMPPPKSHKKLKPEEVELLKKWIEMGAPWQKHWAFISPEKAPLPPVKNSAWVKNPVDQFVLAKLESVGLEPAPEAEPRTLFRRLRLDLTGLPPSPAELESFEKDYSSNKEQAISTWIDRLMQTNSWGEHRARTWLDAARYADTHGLHFDNYREMWPYRDWVIRSFNQNKPFSEFTLEQIAGDLLPNPTEDQLIATGFQRCNITTNEGGTIPAENLATYASDRVQTIGWVYLGLTMNCAQCHDHKFDPISMRDYYSMSAFFRNTTQGAFDGNKKDGGGPILILPVEADKQRWQDLPQLIASANEQRNKRNSDAKPEFEKWLAASTPDSILREELPKTDLVLNAPLNEGDGTVVRATGSAPAEYNATGELTWQPNGKFGSSPSFKKGTFVSLGETGDFSIKQPFSFGAWVKVGKGDSSGAIISKMDVGSGFRGYDLYQSNTSFVVHIVDKFPEVAIKVSTVSSAKPGTWQHLFVTYDGSGKASGVQVYVDGKVQKLSTQNDSLKPDSSINTKVPLIIGQRSTGHGFEEGSVQDVRIYSRKLQENEVITIADAAAVASVLATPAEKRDANQNKSLLSYYLNRHDQIFIEADARFKALEAEKAAIRDRSPLTHIQEEVKNKKAVANILMRGSYDKPGEEVEALPPTALHPLPEGAPKNRLGLAQWLVDKNNPLTPRVTVNRFWQEVFGQGIVRTAEDFGLMGAAPANVDLLDWLAADFRDSGGDVRRLFKLMLSSNAYRQSAALTPLKLEKDRDNALLSRGPRFRMDAEMIRDYALTVSGLLSPKMFGPSVRPYQPDGIWDVVGLPGGDTRNYRQDTGESLYRRTLYSFWKRMAPPPNMDTFNAPSRELSCVRRERTNTPLQALVTLNDPQFVEAARRLAENALTASQSDENKTLDYILQNALGRTPSAKEKSILLQNQKAFLQHYSASPNDAKALIAVGDSKPTAQQPPETLAAWTMVCNQVLNLDEILNK